MFHDQAAALAAHARLSAKGTQPAPEPVKRAPSRRLMAHLCRTCGATDPVLFLEDRRNLCKPCKHKQQNEARTTARRSVKAKAASMVRRGRKT